MQIKEIPRNYSLDFIKIIATIIIIFHHFQQVTGVTYPTGINYYGGQFYWGYIVELFFVLSGFFMHSYIKKIQGGYSLFEFYLRRALRLLPLVTISVVVSEVCILAHYVLFSKVEPHSQINVWSAITTCLGIQRSWFFTVPSLTVNNPVWYISVLLLCYLTFYLLTRYHGRLPLFLVYLGMIFLGFSVCEYDINFPFLTLESARGYYSFYTGLLLAMLLQRNRITGKMGLICFSIIAGFVLTYVKAPSIYQPGLSYLLAVVIYPCLIILFQTDFVKKRFHHPTWGLWGKISFDVYIWHGVLLTILKSAMELFSFEDILQVRAGMYIFMFICEVVGILSYYLLEKNINKKVNKRFPELLQSLNAVLR